MPKSEEYNDEELYDDQVESSFAEESDEDMDPKEEAFLKGYEEADRIEDQVDWEFDDE